MDKRVSTIHKVVSVATISLSLGLFIWAGVKSRWGYIFSGVTEFLFAGIIWLVWVNHLIWMMTRWKSKLAWKSLTFCSLVLASLVAIKFLKVGEWMRDQEIRAAINAGLYDDCMRLLNDWPAKDDRIFSEAEYSRLPESIKMLKPVYVTNDRRDWEPTVPNIGICKNGFGGFADGIRVFRTDDAAEKFKKQTQGGCKRIAPGVYYWWHPT